MLWSILICTLPKRQVLLQRLLGILAPQVENFDVEVLINSDDGTQTIGTKRNKLLNDAKGQYISFIDDDDRVSPVYVSRHIEAVMNNPGIDSVGFYGLIQRAGMSQPRLFYHSHKIEKWETSPQGVYLRYCNHLNMVKSELAKQVMFPEISHGEDRDYSDRLKPLIKTCVDLELPPVYFYDPKGVI